MVLTLRMFWKIPWCMMLRIVEDNDDLEDVNGVYVDAENDDGRSGCVLLMIMT